LKPLCKLDLNNANQILESLEIDIVCAQSAGQLPDPFHRVQIRTIGRQEIQPQDMTMFVEPGTQGACMMPTGIVKHDDHLAPMASPAQQSTQEGLKSLRVKRFGWHRHHSTIGRTNCTKDGHLFASRSMQHYGIQIFWRNPHGTA
jgi:hypothetical protein